MTNNSVYQYIADVRSAFKILANDDLLSDRYIASELIKTNLKLVNQQLNKRIGWNSPNLFTTLPCIPMKEVSITECCDVSIDCTISRSVNPLPAIADSKFSLVVQGVWSVDKRFRYKETSANRYANYLSLNKKNKNERFFWILDNYLYLSDPMIDIVAISAFFPEPIDPVIFSCDQPNNYCPPNPLELEFKTLPFLKDDIVNITYKKILETYKRSIPDQEPDNIDDNK